MCQMSRANQKKKRVYRQERLVEWAQRDYLCVRRAINREIRVFEPRVRRDLFCVRGRVQFDNLWCQGKSFPAGIPEETALLVFKSNGVPTPPLLLWSLDEPGLTRLRLQEIRLFPTRTRSQHDA